MATIWWILGAVMLLAALLFFGLVLMLAWATRGGSPLVDESIATPVEPMGSPPADLPPATTELPASSEPVSALTSRSNPT